MKEEIKMSPFLSITDELNKLFHDINCNTTDLTERAKKYYEGINKVNSIPSFKKRRQIAKVRAESMLEKFIEKFWTPMGNPYY